MRDGNLKNKTDIGNFLNFDEQTEQDFFRAGIKRNYVPKTDYSDFAADQTVGKKNGKKHGVGLFRSFLRPYPLAVTPAQAGVLRMDEQEDTGFRRYDVYYFAVRGKNPPAENPANELNGRWIIQ